MTCQTITIIFGFTIFTSRHMDSNCISQVARFDLVSHRDSIANLRLFFSIIFFINKSFH